MRSRGGCGCISDSIETAPNLVIKKGSFFSQVIRWETAPFKYARIESIENSVPVRIKTIDPHGIPPGWNVAVVASRGLTQLNAKENPPRTFRRATVIDPRTIEFDGLSGAGYGTHVADSGSLQWYSPHSLDQYDARMDIRDALTNELIVNLSVSNDRIIIDDTEKTITLQIEDVVTDDLPWPMNAVFDLEMVSPDGKPLSIYSGVVTSSPGITTS